MLQTGIMMSYSSESFHSQSVEREIYDSLENEQHEFNNISEKSEKIVGEKTSEHDANISPIPRDTPVDDCEESESLGSKIQLLKTQMIALRESSLAFRENMEAVLSTIQGISQSTTYNTDWTLRSSGNKTLPQFRPSSGKRLLTGIASRIERTNMEIDNLGIFDGNILPYSCPVTPSDRPSPNVATPQSPVVPVQELKPKGCERDRPDTNQLGSTDSVVSKRQLKVNTEGIRPSSESFAHNNKGNMDHEIPDEERTNSLPLTQAKNTSCKRILLTHTSNNGIDGINGLRASETSIDSGYHGSNNVPQHGRVYSPASPLAKIYDESLLVETEAVKNKTRPKIPSYLPLSKAHENHVEPSTPDSNNCSNLNNKDNVVNNETAPTLPPKKGKIVTSISSSDAAMKPRVPRSSKKIKMGVSSVLTSPLPKARTVFTNDCTSPNYIREEKQPNKEVDKQIKPRTRVSMSKDDDEISVLRRRSMRMMTEFKLFDFSDCMASNAKPTELQSKPIIIDIDVKKEKLKVESAQAQASIAKQSKPRRSSLKPRRNESKFPNEPLPSPPLPPPPPAPPVESPPRTTQNTRVPEFKDFSSLAKDSKKSVVCKMDSNTPVSSPAFVRKNKINQELASLHQNSQTSFQNTAALTPSNGSAFTPVSAWSDVSLDDLTSPGFYVESMEKSMFKNIHQTSHIVVPQPIRPVPQYEKQEQHESQNQFLFKRKGSLPLAAISNRSKYKQQQQNAHEDPTLTPQMPLKRVQSLRERRNHGYSGSGAPTSGRTGLDHLENDPVAFNRNENLNKVVSALRNAGYGRDNAWVAQAEKNSRQRQNHANNSQQTNGNFQRSKSREQNITRERREEIPIERSLHGQSERSSRNKSTIDIIRASFRGKRGKSLPATSSTNASHEFSTGLPRCEESKGQSAIKREDQSAPPPSSRRNSQNKVKQRVDQKPVTPVPSVEKARRKKHAQDKSQSKSSGISLYEKLRSVALKQQINLNNKKQSHEDNMTTPKSKHQRQRISSQTSEKSHSSQYSDRSKHTDPYPTGSLASTGSMASYSSSITSNNRKNKKSTFV